MIFVGDIALPYPDAVKLGELPLTLENKNWFGNLEGGIIDFSPNLNSNKIVFNDSGAISKLIDDYNFVGFGCANNHIMDVDLPDYTISFLKRVNIPNVGLGMNSADASLPLLIDEDGNEILILNFGWEVIQCKKAAKNNPGVNPLTKENVINSFKNARAKYPIAKIVVFLHWSYELEAEPQPFERELAKNLINLGAFAIIGCHPHRIGGFELYRGRPIIYSLGNWLFRQNFYHDSKLKFPDFCNDQVAFEINFSKDELYFHFFKFDPITNIVDYVKSYEGINILVESNEFAGMDVKDYKIWYKNNHFHKKKGLPIYYWNDSNFVIFVKNKINKFRDFCLVYYKKYI